MDNFYYNLLNIGKKTMTIDEYESTLKRVIEEETTKIKKENKDLSKLCIIISRKINYNDLKRYIGSIMYEDDINKIDINIEDLV